MGRGSNGEGTSGILCCPDAVSKGFMAIVGFIINTSRHWWNSKKKQIDLLINNSTFWEQFEFFLTQWTPFVFSQHLGKTRSTKLSVTQKPLHYQHPDTTVELSVWSMCPWNLLQSPQVTAQQKQNKTSPARFQKYQLPLLQLNLICVFLEVKMKILSCVQSLEKYS